eukprot:1623753-Karenia_brevis.AAC.1
MRCVTLNCRQKYGCEIKDDKRKFGMGVVGSLNSDGDVCAFKDIAELGQEKAWCDAHKKECFIPRTNGAIMGLS